MSTAECASYLGCSVAQIDELCRTRELPFVDAGKTRLIWPQAVARFKQRGGVIPPPPDPAPELVDAIDPRAVEPTQPTIVGEALGRLGFDTDSMTRGEQSETANQLREHGIRFCGR